MSYPRIIDKFNSYLPLTGGNLTGQLKTSSTEGYMASNTSHTKYGYPYETLEGGLIAFRSKNYTNNPGGFEIFARNEDNTYTLAGRADNKSLIWAGQHVLYNTYKITSAINFYTDVADTALGIRDSAYNVCDTPTAQRLKAFRIFDNAGHIMGDIRVGVSTASDVFTQIVARNYSSDGATQINSAFTVKAKKDGTKTLDFNGLPVLCVTKYTSGTTWYRVYSDGWKEMGGKCTPNNYDGMTVTLPKAFSNTNYEVLASSCDTVNKRSAQAWVKTASTIGVRTIAGTGQSQTPMWWYACGY